MISPAAISCANLKLKLKLAVCFALTCTGAAAAQQAAPQDGMQVLRAMHDAYAGKWYKTLTFTQKTTRWLPDSSQRVDTWYESVRHFDDRGTLLRIDIGDPSAGNGLLFSVDSTWVLRAGKLVATRPHGNEFLPLIEGVYVQPVEKTALQLQGMGFDVSKSTAGVWQDRPVWIVGTTSSTDTTSSQFWVDKERNVVVRAVIAGPGAPSAMQIRLLGYQPVGKGWLATRVEISAGGRPLQNEEYSGWQSDVDLPAALFDVSTWTSAPHWVKPK